MRVLVCPRDAWGSERPLAGSKTVKMLVFGAGQLTTNPVLLAPTPYIPEASAGI
jgi:hypothetical protein